MSKNKQKEVTDNKTHNLNKKQLRTKIIEYGGVVPRGHGSEYGNYLVLIEKYRTKVQSPLNVKL